MRYFLTLLRAHLVCRLRSSAFWACALCFLLLAATLAAALPQENRLNLEVGLLPQGTWGEQVAGQLLSGEDFRYRRYTQRRELERDILTGTLHCGYLLEEGEVTALVTDGSYMRPLLDELVFTAANQVDAPTIALEFLRQSGQPTQGTAETFQRLSKTEPPMTVEVVELGKGAPLERLVQGGAQPLFYACLVTAFLASAVAAALLDSPRRQQALRQLAVLGGRRMGTALGSAAGELLLNIPVLAAAQLAAGVFLPNAYYPWQARAVLSAALAVLAALCYLAAGAARRFQRILAVLLPLWCFGNVFFSGALIDPARLPYGLGALRLFSPAWYGLRLLESFL